MLPHLPITPVPADDFMYSVAFVLLVVAVIVLVAFVVWLGRRLTLQIVATRQVAESQRLARREGQHRREVEDIKSSRRWFIKPGDGSGPVAIQRTPMPRVPPPPPPPRIAKPSKVARRKVVEPIPPPLPPPQPPVALGVEYVDNLPPAPDWCDSRPLTELDLRPDPDDVEPEPIEMLPAPSTLTEPFELVKKEDKRTAVWPHRKLPRTDD